MFWEMSTTLEFVILYNIVDKNAEENMNCCDTFCARFVGELNEYWGELVRSNPPGKLSYLQCKVR